MQMHNAYVRVFVKISRDKQHGCCRRTAERDTEKYFSIVACRVGASGKIVLMTGNANSSATDARVSLSLSLLSLVVVN